MTEKIVYQNGDWVPEEDAKVSIWNRGFTLGDAVYEATRTFNGKLFKAREHVDRLYRSMKPLHLEIDLTPEEMLKLTEETVEKNAHRLKDCADFFVYHYVSRGPGSHPMKSGPCEVHIACKDLNFKEFARFIDTGVHLVVASARRQPPQVWDAKIKTTSRVTHTLADIDAYNVDPDAWCLMLDLDGNVAENKSSNVGLVTGGEIHVPHLTGRLTGVTERTIKAYAEAEGIPYVERDIQVYDLLNCDEAFLSTTIWCVVPATCLNGQPIGCQDVPGPMVQRIANAFSEMAGFDVHEQARQMGGINTKLSRAAGE